MSYADDNSITDSNPINRYLAVPVPDSVVARENALGAFSALLDGWRYGADGESALSQWHENNQAFWTLAAIDMEAEIVKAAIVYDEKAQGVTGGTFTGGAWRQRDLNAKNDPNNLVTIGTNQITIIVAGNYLIHALAPAYNTDRHQSRLLKNGVVLQVGSIGYDMVYSTNPSRVFWTGTLAVNDVIKLEHRATNTSTGYGFGVESTWGVSIYSIVELLLLA